MLTEISGKFHLDGTTSSDDSVCLDSSQYDHDSIIKGAGSLLDVLRGATSDDNCDRFSLGALSEHIISLATKLDFFELTAGTENIIIEAISSGLQDSTGCLAYALQIFLRDTTCAENASVCEVLGGQVTDWEL